MATIKIRFHSAETGKRFTMMFGDSYKKWKEQYKEYLRLNEGKVMPIMAWKSNSKFVGWGGLKWCDEEEFQNQLNREGMSKDEADNLNARQYSSFVFKEIQLPTNSQLKNI